MIGRCKDCKWWKVEWIPRAAAEMGDCVSPFVRTHNEDWASNAVCGANNGYDGITTGPDFGCVNFEAATG